jgi:hypothetical protein
MALHLQKYLDAQAFSGKARLAIERMFTAFLGEILTAGSGVTVTYDDETGEFEFGAAGGGGSSVIGASFDGQGAPIAVDTYCDIYVPFDCTITGVVMLAEQVGAIVVDVWADTYGNYPPTNADSICAAAPPTIAAANKSTDTTLTGWTTAVAAGTTLRFNVESVSLIERLALALTVTKT